MKKILLVNPHETQQLDFTNPPIGLLSIAGTLLNHGFDVRLVDGCLEGKAAVRTALESFRPDIVGITCLTPGRKKAIDLATMVKEVLPRVSVVLGGAHPTIMHQQIMQHYPFVDYIVLGEGEQTCLELAQGREPLKIAGMVFRKDGKIVKTAQRKNIKNLDDLPLPAWHLIDPKKYPARGSGVFRGIDLAKEPRLSVAFSRGCTGHCDFCSTWWIWKGWRHRSAENMVDELELLYRDHGIRHFCFADDTLTVDRRATIELCDEILSRKLKIAFHATTRTDCVDEEVLRKMHEAGCYQIAFGIETGSQSLLEKMGKENDIAASERAIQLAKQTGISVTALMIIGNVGETTETMIDTIRFLQRTEPSDIGCVGGLWVLPGTKLYRECKQKKFIDDEFWLGDEPYMIYTQEWSLEKLDEMQKIVMNYRNINLAQAHAAQSDGGVSVPTFLQKWRRYVQSAVNEYSATTEWIDAQEQHVELMAELPSSCKDVLDLGCGDGWSTHRLRQLGKNATGLTINPKEAEHARKAYGLELVVGDMHDLSLPDRAFDGIYCRESYEHTVAPYIALCEMNRVLKLNGNVLINLPWEEWIREDSHFSVFSPAQMREMFFKCRFMVEREGRTVRGHFWYLARKVAEIGSAHPCSPPIPGKLWLNGQVIEDHQVPTAIRRGPRIIGMLRIKNEEQWIIPTLEKASPVVDGFVILDDGSTDRTPELCRSHPKVLRYEYQNEAATDEARDKDRLLQWTLDLDPDWALALDGDELLEDAAPDIIRREIALCPPAVTALGFNFLYMWDSHARYRVDGKYANLRHPRLIKVKGIGTDPRTLRFRTTGHGANFHCGSVPANLPGQVRYIHLNVKHYGYFEKQQRERKKAFYLEKDPENAARGYYDHLTNEDGMELLPWSERWNSGQTGSREAKATPTATYAAKPKQVFAETDLSPDAAPTHPHVRPYEALPQYYRHVRPEIIATVPADARNILDVGCGAGALGKALKQQTPHRRVVGIELDGEAFHYAQQSLDAAYHAEVEQFDPPFKPGEFDCIIFADILEHLKDPWKTVREYVAFLRPGGTVVASIPNVRRLTILRDLAEHGNWEYGDEGILDRTHLRFFTRKQFQQLLEGAEIACHRVEYLRGDEFRHLKPLSPDRTVRFGKLVLENVDDKEFEELCALQILFIGTYQPKNMVRRAASAMSASMVNSGPVDWALRTGQRTTLPAVSIVIPVFNKVEYTRKCIQALGKNTFAGNYELIVVDNASTDGTADFLKSLNGQVIVITNAENIGFTKACNQGAKIARGEYVLFLNNDTEPRSGWLEALTEAFASDPNAGIAGSKLVYPDGRLQEAGGIIFSDGSGWNYGRFDDPEKPEYNYVREVDYVSGASLMVRRSLLNTLGYFDEQYSPGYYEDTDLCFAARAAGYKVLYTPFSVVVHHEGVSSGTDLSQGMKQYQIVNHAKFIEKWREALRKQYSPSNDNVVKASERNVIGNILVIDPFLPMFDRASGSLRLFTIVSLLRSQGYHLSYIARNGGGQERYVEILRKMGVAVYATDPDVLRTMGYDIPAPRIDLEGMLAARRFDTAYLSFYEIALQYLAKIRLFSPSTKIIIDTVDIHFVREKRQAELANDPEALVRAETTKLRELSIYSKADLIITVTEPDWNNVSESLRGKPHFVIPNIHAVHDEAVNIEGRSGIIFVGNFSHLPNIDSVIYFVNQIFPIVRKTLPKVIFTVVGNNPPKEILDLKSKNIIVTGYVPSTEPYLGNARVSVAPLRYGAGMKGKIGEAMALGVPVVTTSIGSEGMGLVHEETAFIADDPKEFANHIIRLCSDNELWSAVSEKGRQFINEHFSTEKVAVLLDRMINVLENISPLDLTDEEKTSMAVTGGNLRKDVVSIVILTFNELKYTKECIESIRKHTPEPHEIIFVDNASSDGTLKWLRKMIQENPNYRLIENKKNLGFAAGNNQGIALANGNYVLLLNNDTVVSEGWLARMLSVFKRYPEVGIVGPVSNNISGPQQVQGVSYQSLEEMPHFAKQWSAEHIGQTIEYYRVVGFCLLAKRAVIDRIGGLDEQFGSGNFEDDDFCLRAAATGYKARIVRDAFIHHAGSQTFKGAGINYQKSLERNWEIFKRKWKLPQGLPYGASYTLNLDMRDLSQYYIPFPPRAGINPLIINTTPPREEAEDTAPPIVMFEKMVQDAQTDGNWEHAIQLLTEALNLDQTNNDVVSLWNDLGYSYFMAGQSQQAEIAFSSGLKINPHNLDLLNNLASFYLHVADYDKATNFVNRALRLNPHDVGALRTLGDCAIKLAKFDVALRAYEHVKKLSPATDGIDQVIADLARLAGADATEPDKTAPNSNPTPT